MRASELMAALATAIAEHGDLVVVALDVEWAVYETVTRVTRIDIRTNSVLGQSGPVLELEYGPE